MHSSKSQEIVYSVAKFLTHFVFEWGSVPRAAAVGYRFDGSPADREWPMGVSGTWLRNSAALRSQTVVSSVLVWTARLSGYLLNGHR